MWQSKMMGAVDSMRSEVIDRILSVEDEADSIIKEAEERSQKIVLDAQGEASAIVKKAVDEERRRSDALVADATRVMEERVRTLEEKGAGLSASGSPLVDKASVDEAVRRIVSLIVSTDLPGEVDG